MDKLVIFKRTTCNPKDCKLECLLVCWFIKVSALLDMLSSMLHLIQKWKHLEDMEPTKSCTSNRAHEMDFVYSRSRSLKIIKLAQLRSTPHNSDTHSFSMPHSFLSIQLHICTLAHVNPLKYAAGQSFQRSLIKSDGALQIGWSVTDQPLSINYTPTVALKNMLLRASLCTWDIKCHIYGCIFSILNVPS